MTAAELTAVLQHLPPDLDVHVTSHFGQHVGIVRHQRRKTPREMAHWLPIHGPRVLDPAVVLMGAGRWWEPAPPFVLSGSFRNRDGLDRELDRLAPVEASA